MTSAQMAFYMQELKRKQMQLEWDQDRVQRMLERAMDETTKLRLKQELETIEIRLRKVKRGLLY